MAGSAGSVYVDLLLRDGRYRQGLKQSRDYTKRWSGQISGDTKRAESAFAQVLNPVSNLEVGVLRLGASVAGALSVSQIINYSDTWKQLQGRLGLVVDGTAELATVNKQLSDIAERTRQPLESIVNLYARMGQMIPENIRGSLDLLDVTEGVATSLAITGESSLSAQAAIIQFTQALSTNFEAAGQEIRSIQEQAPRLALALQRSIGDGTQSLKELKETGQLTTESLGKAFRRGNKEFDKLLAELEKIDPTVRQAFTELNNQVLQFVGGSGRITNAAKALADGIRLIAENLELVAKGLQIGALALTLKTLDSGVSKIVSGFVAGRVVADFSNGVKDLRTQTGSLIPVTAKATNEILKFNSDLLVTSKSTNALTASKKAFSDISKSNNVVLGSSSNFFQNLTARQDILTVSTKNLNNSAKLLTMDLGSGGASRSMFTLSESTALANTQFADFSKSVPSAVGNATKQFSSLEKTSILATTAVKRLGLGLKSLFFGFGPLNIAILALGTAYVFLKDRMSEAEKIAEKYPELFDEISGSAKNASDSVDEIAKEATKRRFRELSEEADNLNKSLNEIRKAKFLPGADLFFGGIKNLFDFKVKNEIQTSLASLEVAFNSATLTSEELQNAIEYLIEQNPDYKASLLEAEQRIYQQATALKVAANATRDLNKAREELANSNLSKVTPEQIEAAINNDFNPILPPSKKGENAEAIDEAREIFLNKQQEEAQQRRKKAQQSAISAATELNSLYRSNREYLTDMTREEIARADKLEELEKLLGTKYIPTQEKLNEAIKRYDESLQDNTENVNQWGIDISEVGKNAAESIQSSFADFLFDPFEKGVAGMAEGFINSVKRMFAEAAAANLMRALFGGGKDSGGDFFSGLLGSVLGGGGSSATSGAEGGLLSGLFAGYRAEGGPIPAGQFAVVGERGPELAFGGTSGKTIMPITNNSKGSVVYNIDARGAKEGVEQQIKQVLMEVDKLRKDTPKIAVASVQNANNRNLGFLT